MVRSMVMQLSELYLALGQDTFSDLLKRVSIGRLRTYQIYEHIKLRTRLTKLNSEALRKSATRLWDRLQEKDEDLAADLSQAILVSHLEMIIATLDFLGVPHQDGFFAKDADVKGHLSGEWQQRAFDQLKAQYPPSVLAFYLNHLGIETGASEAVFAPAS